MRALVCSRRRAANSDIGCPKPGCGHYSCDRSPTGAGAPAKANVLEARKRFDESSAKSVATPHRFNWAVEVRRAFQMQSRQCIVGLKPICQQTFRRTAEAVGGDPSTPSRTPPCPGCTTLGANNVTGPMTRFLLRGNVRKHLPGIIRRAFLLLLA
jgi:hypothetical protein